MAVAPSAIPKKDVVVPQTCFHGSDSDEESDYDPYSESDEDNKPKKKPNS